VLNWSTCCIGGKSFCFCQWSLPTVSSVTCWHLPSALHYCWSTAITVFQIGELLVVTWSKIRAIKMVVKKTHSWNAQAMLEWDQLCADAHCREGVLHWMSPFHTVCSEQPSTVFNVSQYKTFSSSELVDFGTGLQKLAPRCNKCFSSCSDTFRSNLNMYKFFVHNFVFPSLLFC
jgi:hypothetical protein